MIAIFDYGAGNLRSVQNTLDEIGAPYELVRDAAGLERAPKIILPGVGHFGQMLRALDEMNVREALIARINANVPFLGICLGLQGLFESSAEAPDQRGLGIFPGTVERFEIDERVPHMGWNQLERGPPVAPAQRPAGTSVRLLRPQLLRAGGRTDRRHLHLLDPLHGRPRIRQYLRRAVPSRKIRPARPRHRAQLRGA